MSTQDPLIGRQLGRYKITRKLGAGGMASVYLAEQPAMHRQVAIKVLPAAFLQDENFLTRFSREVKIIAGLEHPRILPVYDFGEADGQPYIVMRYVSGGTLTDELAASERGLSLDRVVQIADQIGEGLDFAHRKGIIHRDFKPSNVLLDEEGNCYLADFGIAKASAETASLTGTGIVGTPSYMAPEIAGGDQPTSALDVYALGITVFQLFTRQSPFRATTPMGILMAHATEAIPDVSTIRPDLPPAVSSVIAHATAKRPENRTPSAGLVAAELRAAAGLSGPAFTPLMQTMIEQDFDSTIPETPAPSWTPAAQPIPRPSAPTAAAPAATPAPSQPARAPRRGMNWVLILAPLALVMLCIGACAGSAVLQVCPPGGPWPMIPWCDGEVIEAGINPTITVQEPSVSEPAGQEPTSASEPLAAGATDSAPSPTATSEPASSIAAVTSNSAWQPVTRQFNGVQMALVPPGCFTMGGGFESDEQPAHQQCFDEPYWIDVAEVTLARWSGGSNRPVESVDWFQATSFCQAQGGRLPTEREWEYAARGPDGLIYPGGNSFSDSFGAWSGNSGGQSAAVGSYPQGVSWVGAYDMAGNVYEWVSSLYKPYPYSATDGREDPNATGDDVERVIRGGSWASRNEESLRGSFRFSSEPDGAYSGIGLRCVRDYEAGDY